MSEPKATDYAISAADAKELLGAVLLPAEFRTKLLAMYAANHGREALIELFAQFIGLANSVVANGREMAEIILITEGNMWPQEAEKANLPTIFGALNGVLLADKAAHTKGQKKMCGGCAFRLGTAANQSPVTTIDAEWCDKDQRFMCHEDLDEAGEPTHTCWGFARSIATRASLDEDRGGNG